MPTGRQCIGAQGMQRLSVLGIVPARGGSKGVPHKNIRFLGGQPLLHYTAHVALASKRLTRVVLSTEDEEIAHVGRACGLEVPFLRSAELARDDTPTIPVLQDMVRKLEAQGCHYDAIMVLQPTNPLRNVEDIDGSIHLLEKSGADSVVSLVDATHRSPARMKYIDHEGRVVDPPFGETKEGQRRQELTKVYLRDGAIYLARHDVLMRQNSLKGKDCRAWIIPEERAWSIDTMFDWFIAEQLVKYHGLA